MIFTDNSVVILTTENGNGYINTPRFLLQGDLGVGSPGPPGPPGPPGRLSKSSMFLVGCSNFFFYSLGLSRTLSTLIINDS